MELYYSFSILLVLASFFAYLNHRFIKLPAAIGIMLIAIVVSIAIRIVGHEVFPATSNKLFAVIAGFDFTEVLMGAMLNFLLFAAAIHVRYRNLREQRLPIMVFSSVSVIISAFVISILVYLVAPLFDVEIPFLFCLLFGALISPTDPIAVLGILKKANVPRALETKIAGESLFNDGVAVVFFAVVLQLAQSDTQDISFVKVAWLLVKEAGGGMALGILLGLSASRAMRKVDDYIVSVLITLSVVTGGYLVAHAIHISSPLTMVAAGIIIGNYGKRTAMSQITQDYLTKFWELVDEVMNAILFLYIGFELLLIPNLTGHWIMGIVTIGIVLLARFLSIWVPSLVVPLREKFDQGTLTMLVWGALRGGVSIALVLSMNNGPYKEILLEITYFVVVFSIVVQGLTVGKIARRVMSLEKRG